LAHRYRQRRRQERKRYSPAYEAAKKHIAEARALSQFVGGTDVDVKRYFFSLKPEELTAVLDEYAKRYGRRAREYAETAIPKWRSRSTKMSGTVAERLYALLPPGMPLSVKYDMVRTLWTIHGPSSSTRLVVGTHCPLNEIVSRVQETLSEKVSHYTIPPQLQGRFAWLAAGDVSVAQELLNHFLDEEKALVVADAKERIPVLLRGANINSDVIARVTQRYEVGRHAIDLVFVDERGLPESLGCALVALACVGILSAIATTLPRARISTQARQAAGVSTGSSAQPASRQGTTAAVARREEPVRATRTSRDSIDGLDRHSSPPMSSAMASTAPTSPSMSEVALQQVRDRQFATAISLYERVLAVSPSDIEALNGLAWLLATCPDDQFRDGARAVALSDRMIDVFAGQMTHRAWATVAASYAQALQFEQAVMYQKICLERCPASESAEASRRLDLYRRHLRYRDPP